MHNEQSITDPSEERMYEFSLACQKSLIRVSNVHKETEKEANNNLQK